MAGASRRSGVDIIVDILEASLAGIKKTHLMIKCNLSFPQLKRYLDLTVDKELLLVQDNGGHSLFRTSVRGRRFLKTYKGLKDLVE